LITSAIPPLGFIGWAHPVTTAGILLPGTGWIGLATVLAFPGLLVCWPRPFLTIAACAAISANLLAPQPPARPGGWEAVQTRLGNTDASVEAQFAATEEVVRRIRSSTARVLVFPEAVIPRWSAFSATWLRDAVQVDGTAQPTVLVGALIPDDLTPDRGFVISDFAGAINALKGGRQCHEVPRRLRRYRNALVIVDSNHVSMFDQHVPVPLAMCRPFLNDGVKLKWAPNSPVNISGRKACILICYEALLVWPAISAMASRPSVLVAISNDFWIEGSRIAAVRESTVTSWSRLWQVPSLLATNR
jgi:predicted amidohydrolase